MTTIAAPGSAANPAARANWYRTVAGALATWGTWTSWYSLAIIAVTLPSAWLGGRIARLRAHS